jgi:hypothetical protein
VAWGILGGALHSGDRFLSGRACYISAAAWEAGWPDPQLFPHEPVLQVR